MKRARKTICSSVAVVVFIFFGGQPAESAGPTLSETVATRNQAHVVQPGAIKKPSSAVTSFDEPSLPRASLIRQENQNEDTQLLLVFKAYPPHERKDRNFYELAREIRKFVDSPRFPPTGVVTDGTVRYGVFAAKRVKVLKTTDSRWSSRSQGEGAYVLVLDPIYTICARSYTVHSTRAGKRKITYRDCESGEGYEIPLRKRSPLTIYEIEILTGDIFRQLWQEKVGRHGSNEGHGRIVIKPVILIGHIREQRTEALEASSILKGDGFLVSMNEFLGVSRKGGVILRYYPTGSESEARKIAKSLNSFVSRVRVVRDLRSPVRAGIDYYLTFEWPRPAADSHTVKIIGKCKAERDPGYRYPGHLFTFEVLKVLEGEFSVSEVEFHLTADEDYWNLIETLIARLPQGAFSCNQIPVMLTFETFEVSLSDKDKFKDRELSDFSLVNPEN